MFYFNFNNDNDRWDYLKRNYEYKVDGSNVEIIKAKINEEYLIIPNFVTTIGEECFKDCSKLKEIVIPDSVIKIGKFAFKSCISLRDIYIGSNVRSIGGWAFDIGFPYHRHIYKIINKSSVNDDGIDNLKEYCFVYLTDEDESHQIKKDDNGYTIGFADDCCLVYDVPSEKIVDYFFEFDGIYVDGKKQKNVILLGCNTLREKCESCIIKDDANVISLFETFVQSKLKRIILPNKLEELNGTFLDSSYLEYIRFPKEMKRMINACFINCPKLNITNIPDGIEILDEQDLLTTSKETYNVTIPKSVKQINYGVWGNPTTCEINLNITFLGTKEEWSLIKKEEGWFSRYGKSKTIVTCSDGIIYERKGR